MAGGNRLEGKVAIVTGGASGIGLATVERFVTEGANVIFCDLDPGQGSALGSQIGNVAASLHHARRAPGGPNDGSAIAERLGSSARFIGCDITDASSLGGVFEAAHRDFGGLDILVNNAGVGGGEISIEQCDDALFDRTIAVNLKAVWQGMKLAFPLLRARGGGSIVTTSSISALLGMPGQGAYGASKAGVLQLTRVAAMEGARDLIRANAVCPGGIVTPIIYDSPLMKDGFGIEAVEKGLAASQPLPLAGQPDDIANAILWLASDESRFVTGQTLSVDGGLTAEFDSKHRKPLSGN
ncbi:SDR family NAD(P)-dependent oxidoreductase [Sphingopyxis sp.]|uniref:SDR family NAD(P)-dependent oxidoreductase n=1 Tax=Sphingopyxis sp. TaxID=1908224 RepID=UPI002ED90DA8